MGLSGTHAGMCPGQRLIVGEGLAGPAWSINEDELGLCDVGMPRLEATNGGLDPADDCPLVCVEQKSLMVRSSTWT